MWPAGMWQDGMWQDGMWPYYGLTVPSGSKNRRFRIYIATTIIFRRT